MKFIVHVDDKHHQASSLAEAILHCITLAGGVEYGTHPYLAITDEEGEVFWNIHTSHGNTPSVQRKIVDLDRERGHPGGITSQMIRSAYIDSLVAFTQETHLRDNPPQK